MYNSSLTPVFRNNFRIVRSIYVFSGIPFAKYARDKCFLEYWYPSSSTLDTRVYWNTSTLCQIRSRHMFSGILVPFVKYAQDTCFLEY